MSLPLAVWTLIFVHECGHAFGALATGLKIRTIQAGPIAYDRASNRLFLAEAPPYRGGHLVYDHNHFGPWRMQEIACVAMGPLASLMTGCALAAPRAHWYATIAGVASIVLGVFNLIPRYLPTGQPTDGRLLLDLICFPKCVELARRILSETARGTRPREWSVGLDECIAAAGAANQGWMTLFAYSAAVDRGETGVARNLVERGLLPSATVGGVRNDMVLQGAMFFALWSAESERARHLLEECSLPPESDQRYVRLAEAAVLFAEGSMTEARAAFHEWREATAGSPSPSLTMGGNEWAVDRLTELLSPAHADAG